MKNLLLSFAATLVLNACSTQTVGRSAYVGEETRGIKALAPAEVDGLLGGKGLGFARSAELNGYPGPAHVLELSDELALSAEQISETRAIFSRMEASAKAHGAELVRAERDLETLFRSRQVTAGSLSLAVEQVAAHRAKVRSAHLLAHLEQTALLSSGQVARYIALRGYTAEHVHGTHQ